MFLEKKNEFQSVSQKIFQFQNGSQAKNKDLLNTIQLGVLELAEIKKFFKTCQQEFYPILYGHEIYQKKIEPDRTWFTLPPKPLLFTKIYKGFSKFIKEKYFHK